MGGMCNRFRMTAAQAELAQRYGVALPFPADEEAPPPELFPDRPAWVVHEVAGDRAAAVMRWGFPPPPRAGSRPVTNVCNLDSAFWRSALTNPERRCLVPVTTFCEWEGEKGAKIPRWFALRDQPVFSFAGIWRPTEEGPRMAFLTTGYLGDPAEHIVGRVHPKAVPVILHREDEERWLHAPRDEVVELAAPYPSQLMTME